MNDATADVQLCPNLIAMFNCNQCLIRIGPIGKLSRASVDFTARDGALVFTRIIRLRLNCINFDCYAGVCPLTRRVLVIAAGIAPTRGRTARLC